MKVWLSLLYVIFKSNYPKAYFEFFFFNGFFFHLLNSALKYLWDKSVIQPNLLCKVTPQIEEWFSKTLFAFNDNFAKTFPGSISISYLVYVKCQVLP